MFQHSKCSKMVPLWYENHILASGWPSEIVSKSMPKRLQNKLYVGNPLGTLKNAIFDVKTSSRWTPKISYFFENSLNFFSIYGLGPKMPLRGLSGEARFLLRQARARPILEGWHGHRRWRGRRCTRVLGEASCQIHFVLHYKYLQYFQLLRWDLLHL